VARRQCRRRFLRHRGPTGTGIATRHSFLGFHEPLRRESALDTQATRETAPEAWPPSLVRIKRLDHGNQAGPGHDAFYLRKKLLAARSLLLQCVLGAGKAALVHVGRPRNLVFSCMHEACPDRSINKRLPKDKSASVSSNVTHEDRGLHCETKVKHCAKRS
jgi:hypothetical protein